MKRLTLVENASPFDRSIAASRKEILRHYRGSTGLYASIRSRLVPNDLFRLMQVRLPTNAQVLDVGSGIGYFSLLLKSLRPDIRIQGLELNAKRVSLSNHVSQQLSMRDVAFSESNLYESQFQGQYDAVVALDLLHHLNRAASDRLVHQIHNCLRSRGNFWVKEIDTRPRWRWLFTYLLDLLMARGDRFSYFSLESRIEQLRTTGFVEVEGFRLQSNLPYPHILVTGRKGERDTE